MPSHDLYPVSTRQNAPSGVYFDTAAAARGASIRSSVYDELEFARGVRWALRQRDDDPVAREVLHGVPAPATGLSLTGSTACVWLLAECRCWGR